MEIEAKFAIEDLATFQRLQAIEHIAGFSLSAHQIQQVRDTYLDTDERLMLANGYACRCRETELETLITLKGLGRADGAIHRRREMEVALANYGPPQGWPESPVRGLVLQVTGGAPLVPLFDLRQTRVFRRLRQGELLVAQLSLDNVRIVANERTERHFELEVELAPQGTGSDMGEIVAYLRDEWNLAPETSSKFERALAFLDREGRGGDLLTAQERAICVQLSRRSDLYGRRARGFLSLDEGMSHDEVAQEADRTTRTIRRWLKAFRQERMGSFPNRVLQAMQSTPAAILPPVPTPEADSAYAEDETGAGPEPQPLEALFKRYLVDREHAHRVVDHALTLFEHLRPFHNLPTERRALLETAAMVHNVGLASDPGRHHTVGRDILLTYPPQELDEDERVIVALTTYLHRKRLTPDRLDKKVSLVPFTGLSKRARKDALALSALIRLADGLDYSQTQSSEVDRVEQRGGVIEIEVRGPYAAIDAGRAQEKSDLWHLLFEVELRFRPAHPAPRVISGSDRDDEAQATLGLVPDELPERPVLSPDDTMDQAARKILTFHFQHMLYHEPGTRAGEDIEELHDMRVATRRMRAAFQVFDQYVDRQKLKPIRKGAKRTCSQLGSVRDLDVFWNKTQCYLDTLPAERQSDLMPLREAWEAEREGAREEMLAYLDGDRYREFKERSAELLQMPDVWGLPPLTERGEAVARRIRDVVPREVYECVGGVLAYDEWVDGPDISLKRLHRLRIAGKRLRYTLEFFEGVLAPQARDVIDRVKRLQDHLGDLQDAVVASELLRDFLTWGTWGHAKGKRAKAPKEPIVAPGVAVYMADKQGELQRMLGTFPEVWAYFQSREFRQAVAVILAPL